MRQYTGAALERQARRVEIVHEVRAHAYVNDPGKFRSSLDEDYECTIDDLVFQDRSFQTAMKRAIKKGMRDPRIPIAKT